MGKTDRAGLELSTGDSMRTASLLITALIVSVILGCVIGLKPVSRSGAPYKGAAGGPENSNSTLILDISFEWAERDFYCSEASASMVLKYYGHSLSQDKIHQASERFETMQPFLSTYIKCELVHNLGIEGLKKEVSQGDPVMIRTLLGKYLHTIVVVGYDSDYLYVHDPNRGYFLKTDPEVLLTYWKPTNFAAIIFTWLPAPSKCWAEMKIHLKRVDQSCGLRR